MMFNWFRQLLVSKNIKSGSTGQHLNNQNIIFSNNIQIPDGYAFISGFGYKINWYMIPVYELDNNNWTIKDLANAINLQSQQKMSWNEGVDFSCQWLLHHDNHIYITAPFEGWVYILKSPNEKLDLLQDIVDNYYAFGSYRVNDYVGWKHVDDNNIVRYFVSSCGDVWKNIGSQTNKENDLSFVDLSGLDENEAIEKICSDSVENNDNIVSFFDQDHVIDICEAWTGINPCNFESQPVLISSLPEDGIGGVIGNGCKVDIKN